MNDIFCLSFIAKKVVSPVFILSQCALCQELKLT